MKTSKMTKFLVLLLVAVLAVSPMTSVYAETLVDSTGSDYTDESVGRDETQDKDTVYNDTGAITDTTHSSTAEVVVYATRASKVQYKIPQVIIGDGSTGSATYKVGVKGDISSAQTVSITPPESFNLSDGTRTVVASISQTKKSWIYSDLSSSLDDEGFSIGVGTINFTIPAGSFSGSFNFTITVEQN